MTPHADLVARLRAIASRFDMTSTERYEQDSEAFYAATGYMAPGKDVPMAMGWQNETERRVAHEAWIASRNRSQQQAIQEAADALAALPPPTDPPKGSYCGSCATATWCERFGLCCAETNAATLPADPPHDCEAWRLEGLGCARCNKADPPALVALGERLRTQDNQMTAHPIFVVEHRNDARRPWEFVTACLTDEGARAYMNANGHNLRKFSRIFVHSGYRNDQWIGLRNHLMALPAAPPVTDTPQSGEMPPSSTWGDIGPQPKGWPDGNNPVRWKPTPDCVIGVYCQRHGFIHGQEAEELRERLEELGNKAVNRVLDEVDARDSLAYLEATNEPTPPDTTPPQEDQ